MHECPECGSACVCDGEDTWLDAPFNCTHECDYDDAEGNEEYWDWLDAMAENNEDE